MKFFNIAKMPKKPFSLRSVHCTHIKYAKKNEKIRSGSTTVPGIRYGRTHSHHIHEETPVKALKEGGG
jgi:hypothetical protein